MADTCTCPPASLQYCTSTGGLMLSFPSCQIIPNDTRVENPYFDVINNISYFTYLLTDSCTGLNGPILELYLAICENIPIAEILDVGLRLDGCPGFTSLNYDLNNNSGVTPPAGYRFLRIEVDSNIIEGSSGVFRISIAGNIPVINLPGPNDGIVIVAEQRTVDLSNLRAIGCPIIPRLTVTKNCNATIVDNMATLDYTVIVSNPNSINFDEVLYNDVISFNGSNVQIGQINVTPPDLNIDTSTPGTISITGSLGEISPGESIEINYTVPIVSFQAPGVYSFTNNAIATFGDIEGSALCDVTVDVVSVTTQNCCLVNPDNTGSFNLVIENATNSPQTDVDIVAILIIPEAIELEFTNFNICSAVFIDDATEVPLNTPITNRTIRLVCNGDLQPNSLMTFTIAFRILSSSSFAINRSINMTITQVNLNVPDTQILLPVTPLPNSTSIDVISSVICSTITNRREM